MNSWYKKSGRTVVGVVALAAGFAMVTPGAVSAEPSSTGNSSAEMARILDRIINDFGSLDGGGAGNGQGGAPTHKKCNAGTKSGGAGVTKTSYDMGRSGPMSFKLKYETENVPDRIQVYYQGQQIADTGYVGDNINQGTGSMIVQVPRGRSSSVLIQVTGPDHTEWSYTAYCP